MTGVDPDVWSGRQAFSEFFNGILEFRTNVSPLNRERNDCGTRAFNNSAHSLRNGRRDFGERMPPIQQSQAQPAWPRGLSSVPPFAVAPFSEAFRQKPAS
jgi:hypothetical protein